MNNVNVQTITQVITSERNVTRMVLNPNTVNLRDNFRRELESRLNNNVNELPRLRQVESTDVIDRNSIINLDNETTSERRESLINEVLRLENAEGNLSEIVQHSSTVVLSYINSLLIRYHNNETIPEVDFYRVGNILLYYVSSIELNGVEINQLMGSFRNVMFEYNQQQMIPSFINGIINHSNETLSRFSLLTEEQLNANASRFFEGVDQREEELKELRLVQSRKRVMMVGGSILAAMAFNSLGGPSILSGMVGRGVISGVNTLMDSSSIIQPTPESIRLRDIFDKVLSITYKTLDKFK